MNPSPILTLPIDSHTCTVSCPRQSSSVPFDDCRKCERCWLVKLDGDYGSSFVLCEAGAGAQSQPSSASLSEAKATPVSEIMTSKVVTVRPEISLEILILLLIDNDITGAPVVDESGHPIGVVSRSDLVTDDYNWAQLRADFLSYPVAIGERSENLFLPELFRSRCVGDLMTREVLRLSPHASVADAAAAMEKNPEHCALVVDEADHLAGIVSMFDIVKWIATSAARD